MKEERLVVFIDGSNLYHIVKEIFNSPDKPLFFDIEEFLKEISKSKKLIQTNYYTAPLDRKKNEETYIKQQRFFEKLKRIPNFNLILCRMQREKIDGKTIYLVKEDDIHLAVDMVRLAYDNIYDTAILISSDGDFVPAVKAIQKIGKKVENIGFEHKFSWHLKQRCDKFNKLKDNYIKKFLK